MLRNILFTVGVVLIILGGMAYKAGYFDESITLAHHAVADHR